MLSRCASYSLLKIALRDCLVQPKQAQEEANKNKHCISNESEASDCDPNEDEAEQQQ